MITDSTNPRIMADNIRKLAKNGGSGLPPVTGADDDKVLTVVNGDWAAALPTGSGLHYSTNEIETFDTWTDGRPIYQKTYTGVIARGEYEYYNKMDLGEIAAEAVTGMEGGLYDTNGNIIPLYSTLTASNSGYGDYTWEPRITGGHLEIGLNESTAAIGYNFILTVKYIKATTTKATKRKTTKGEN